ncbi:MAG TPA: chemotaxis protein CheD [Pirellulales bacterium]|nr:chemotaxis protein CheD [Pirellulales bacterium]
MKQGVQPLSLPMGELAVLRTSGVLRTLLGSCLGLALYDRRLKAAALGHIVLPASQGRNGPPGKFADTAVPMMIQCLQELAPGERLKLQAKIAGGANMFAAADARNSIGVQNVAAVERILDALRIPIAGRHCGGEQGRRMMLDAATGLVTIDVVGAERTIL